MIQNLDENGYLALSREEICNATESSPEEVEAVLRRIQFFDPVGVAARDLRECLLIQLENLQLSDSLAARIVADYLSFLESKRYEKLAKDLGRDHRRDRRSGASDRHPSSPSRHAASSRTRCAPCLPDVFVEKVGDEYLIYLNDDGVPRLRVSSLYRRMAGQEGAAEEQARQYLQEKVRAGNLADQEHPAAPADSVSGHPKYFQISAGVSRPWREPAQADGAARRRRRYPHA